MKRLVFAAALALGLTLPVMVQGAIPQPIYFWANVAATISAPGQPPAPEVVRPSLTQPTSRTYARFFYTPSGNIACEMFDNGTAQAGITCIMQKPQAKAGLKAGGVATICQHQGLKCTGNLGYDPSLPAPRKLSYGSAAKVGRLRCTSAFAGLTCVVTRTGKGFFISKQSVRRVG